MSYINRKQTENAIRKYAEMKHSNGEQIEYINGILKAISVINSQPATDVVEIIHGKWIDVPLNSDPNYFAYKYNLRTKCSVCDFAMPREYPRFNICPNCGARMDKEQE